MIISLPQGTEAILVGAIMATFSLRAPKGRRRLKRRSLGLVGFLVEFLFFWGGLTLVLYGVAQKLK